MVSITRIVTESHIPLLQAFQQFVELQEASQIFHSLTTTTSQILRPAINRTYIPLIQSNLGANTQSFAYRGHHETAWMVNRFAHVARKHGLSQLCKDSLTRIYTLPNIEISEAFLKLCEQAKVHFENPDDLGSGFEVISHTT
ncbi:hypothetical protein PGT21_003597 [Puccinia graminis f. sp. tritici]|uniref:PIK-related kinase FAT domain-containing protein n=1 Tax=Puccinia graminis f. sp. tritici TaxID=56615 RepID=A0A5B0QWQ0_PUCGR|nr:hypothetical protein PGT21_003597 [Puccinia graminis f. sp. tritici]